MILELKYTYTEAIDVTCQGETIKFKNAQALFDFVFNMGELEEDSRLHFSKAVRKIEMGDWYTHRLTIKFK